MAKRRRKNIFAKKNNTKKNNTKKKSGGGKKKSGGGKKKSGGGGGGGKKKKGGKKKSPFAALFAFLAMIPKIFQIITGIIMGIKDIFMGLAREFKEFPQGAYYLGMHAAIFVQYLGVFAFTNLFCAMQMIQNFSSCFFWYALDIFGKILYLLPQIIIFFLEMLGVPAKKMETQVWMFLEKIDRIVIDATGFHIIHFPKDVRDKCFNCKRLRKSALIDRANDAFGDLKDPIIPFMTGGIVDMFNGARRVVNALLGPIGIKI